MTRNLSPVIWQMGIDNLFKPLYSGIGSILMFHRVMPHQRRTRIHNHLSLEISPDHLDSIIRYFKKNRYHFTSLDELKEWASTGRCSFQKFVIFTFDDGYIDNLKYAYPIFKKWNIPFTIYVTTAFPNNTSLLWWYILEDIIAKNETVRFPIAKVNLTYSCNNILNKEKTYTQIRKTIMSYNEEERDKHVKEFALANKYSFGKFEERMTLNWDEIEQLANDPLVTIGAHTLNHYNLCSISFDDAKREIKDSKSQIEAHINKVVNHFSYPLGKFNDQIVSFTEEHFQTATTTKTANIFTGHFNNLFTLPRISVNSLTTEKVLRLQVNGFFPAIANKFKRLVV
jgi:peptidoglycan/xylan/chitin deacetylase (PgdA/CDA1 family)